MSAPASRPDRACSAGVGEAVLTKLLCLVGPTAAGKTRMAVEVAQTLDTPVEIVSCDSMGVYRGLDIVADKPTEDERGGIRHHLFDVADPTESFTAATYRKLARATIEEIAKRGIVPMLVGGSGLYFRAVVDELEFAPTSSDLRAQLEQRDPAELFRRLEKDDPATAARLDPRNVRRVVRAVEVLELTGRPPSELRTSWQRGGGPYEPVVAGLVWEREELMRRAEQRVQREIEKGLLDEVRRIGPESFSRTARQALGVKEMIPVIEGLDTLDTARTLLVRNTKNFIRRQMSWFNADPRVVWFNASALSWDGARKEIIELFERGL